MDSSPGEVEGNTEELPGRKKSRFKFLKSRLFGRLKKKETEGQMKQSKSTSDVTAQGVRRGEEDSEDDCQYPQGTLSSRALSHDSIFLADQAQSSEPSRVLSQENVHSKIKALQLKLQQQNIRLGPPPLLIPGKRIEDSGTMSEDDGLPCSPPEMAFQEVATHAASYKHLEANKHLSSLSLAGTGSEEEEQGGSSQPPSRPLSPVSRLSPQAVLSSPPDVSQCSGVDFSSPAHFISCLDNSAARHRMSVKPRNQRLSTKAKKQPADVYRTRSSSMNNLEEPLPEREETTTSTETSQNQSYSSQVKALEEELSSPAPVSHSSSLSLQDQPEIMALNLGPSVENEVLKSEELFQLEVGILKPSDEIKSLDHIRAQVNKEASNDEDKYIIMHQDDAHEDPNIFTSPGLVLNTVTNSNLAENVELGIVDQMEMMKESPDVSRSSETLTRAYPVPAPRTKKPALDNRNNISNTKPGELEKKTVLSEENCKKSVSSESLDESSSEEVQRPSSFRFSIASAKYRSKTISCELVSKQDEETQVKTLSMKNQNLELQVEKIPCGKSSEISKTMASSPDKRSSSQREGISQSASKTNEGCSNIIDSEKSEKADESEEKKGLFGVKLRSTSLSLKYRSDVAKSEDKVKRHSLEAHHFLAVAEKDARKETLPKAAEEERKSSVPTNIKSQVSDPLKDPAVNTDREANTGSWMSLAREKTKTQQPSSIKPSTQSAPTPSSSSSTPSPSSTQQPQKPTPQPRPPRSQLRACHSTEVQSDQTSQQSAPKPAARALLERWASSNQSAEKNTGSQLANGSELLDTKGSLKPGVKNNTQTESDLKRSPSFIPTAKPEPLSSSLAPSSSSTVPQQSSADTGQPSWMELAKRKSLAWSDKSLD